MAYSKQVVERFEDALNNPAKHAVGRFDPKDPNVATGMVGAPACGDVMKLDLKMNGDTIEDVKFKTYGCGSAIFIYIVVNMSMVLGLLPIVGAPLPIMSYGGSAMLTMMIGLGIVMSCKIHKDQSLG